MFLAFWGWEGDILGSFGQINFKVFLCHSLAWRTLFNTEWLFSFAGILISQGAWGEILNLCMGTKGVPAKSLTSFHSVQPGSSSVELAGIPASWETACPLGADQLVT